MRSPPAARKVSRPRMPSSSSVSRQSAEKPGAAMAIALDALAGIGGEHRVGRRLEPFGAAEARLEGDVDRRVRAPRRAAARSSGNGSDRDRRARASAAACRGSSAAAAPARNRARRAGASDAGLQRVDVERVVIIRRQRAQRRLAAHRGQARRTPRRSRSRSSPRNIAGRAARRGCARSRPRSFARSPRRSPDCRSASHNRP